MTFERLWKTFNRLFTIAVLLPVLAASLVVGCFAMALASGLRDGAVGYWEYSQGSRTGHVVKWSRKGTFGKSWAGTLSLGGPDALSTWDFSDYDEDCVEDLQRAADTRAKVQLFYTEYNFKWGSAETRYDITRVVFVDDE